jgi:hypothetical protein
MASSILSISLLPQPTSTPLHKTFSAKVEHNQNSRAIAFTTGYSIKQPKDRRLKSFYEFLLSCRGTSFAAEKFTDIFYRQLVKSGVILLVYFGNTGAVFLNPKCFMAISVL